MLVIDDYGHHPTEIAAVLAAARATLERRLVVAFQPHRYSRTARLMDAFGPALRDADEIVLTDIYAAGEDPIPGVTVEVFAEAVRRGSGRPVHVARHLDEVVPAVMRVVRSGRRRHHAGRRLDRVAAEARLMDALRTEGGTG